ncbi:hypothetical protein BUALT_Bualt03G0177500 [Buddleja alternifolia]|uniref:WRKY domain-containing protein n=1 Tax=Buddleja alternifolia TaxID=168488 RepID=A0AAV6Y1A4_9LAMI|nr:hypothetical protein BUALT_Bualt03G0177500 [Buddleja alternifolia]
MSKDTKNSYPYNSFQDHDHQSEGFSFPIITDHNNNYSYNNPFMYNQQQQQQQTPLQNPNHHEFDLSHMSFSNCLNGAVEYNTLSSAFDLSCSSSGVAINYPVSIISNKSDEAIRAAAHENPSSASFSSSEAGVEEDSSKIKEDLKLKSCEKRDDKSKKVKAKKKEEKKQREARFAFMTKSEVDNMEDGFRWRKYGQKAVKNSPFPRSYYRCTSQKCNVKKRIERSFEDPSMVITTYEGQHNHHSPATLRGNAAALLAPSLFLQPPSFPSFSQELFFPSNNPQNYPNTTHYTHDVINPQPQQPQLPDQYNQWPGIVSSFLHKPQP